MEKYLETRNYIRTQSAKLNLIFSAASWLLILFYIFYQPDLTFEKDRSYIQLKGDTIRSYMIFDKGEGYKLYENNVFYSPDAKLKPVAGYLFDKNKIIVDDEKGNRFAILVRNASSYPEELRILNHQFLYVYNRKDLNGEFLKDIIAEAGDYSFLDKEKRIMVFPQIVLFNGAERTKGVALVYDKNERVIQTGIWDSPYTNLYTHIPYYDKIASLNLFIKFQRFTQENNYEPEFFGETMSSILWFIFDCFACPFVVVIILGGIFYSLYPILYKLCKIPQIPNYLIYILAYSLMPIMILFAIALLYYYNNIWVWAALSVISYLVYTSVFIGMLAPAYVRCSKCRRMNCIDVTETDYQYKKDVISDVGSTWKEGMYEPQEKAQEKLYIRTHYYEKCTCCGNVNEYDTKSTRLEEMRNVSEIDCPVCGKYTLEAGSLLVKNDVNTYRWSSTKKGELRETGNFFGGPDFKRKDVTTHYSETLGTLTYKRICKCSNCGYEYSEMYEKNVGSGKNVEATETRTRLFKRV